MTGSASPERKSLEHSIKIEYIATTIVTTTVAGSGAGRAEPGV